MPAVYASLTVFLLFVAVAFAIYVAIYGSQRPFDERVTDIGVKMRVAYGNPADLDLESDSFANSLFRWVAKRLPEPAMNTPEREKLAQTLVRAGFSGPRAVRTFHFTRLASTAGTAFIALIASVAFGLHGIKPLGLMLVGAGVGAFVPSYYIGRKARQRQQEIANQLSDVLDLLVVCVEAGLGLSEAIKIVGSETERQNLKIGTELSIVSAELGAGSTLGQALKSFAVRTAVDDDQAARRDLGAERKAGRANRTRAALDFRHHAHDAPAARRRKCRQDYGQNSLSARAVHPPSHDGRDRRSRHDSNHARAHLSPHLTRAARHNIRSIMADSEPRTRALELWNEAMRFHMNRDLERAVELYTQSIEVFPTAEAYTFRGWAFEGMGRIDDAIAECRRAIEVDPSFGNPYNDIGAYLIAKGELDEAVPWLEKAKTAPRYDPRHYPFMNLGRIYAAKGMVKRAIDEFEGALAFAPGDPACESALQQLRALLN